MKCAYCNRPMLAAAVFVGAPPIGPTCARKAGLLELARLAEDLIDATTSLLAVLRGRMRKAPGGES